MKPLWLIAALFIALTVPSHADTTYVVTFNATGAGLSPASGVFTLTIDPTKEYHDATAGLTVNSLVFDPSTNPSSSAQAAFDYIPSKGILAIGGLVSGVALVNPSFPDYQILFDQFGTAPEFLVALASQLSTGNIANYDTGTGDIVPTPEPSTFLLLGSGMVAVAGFARRSLRG
jgi:hypothetical protein